MIQRKYNDKIHISVHRLKMTLTELTRKCNDYKIALKYLILYLFEQKSQMFKILACWNIYFRYNVGIWLYDMNLTRNNRGIQILL